MYLSKLLLNPTNSRVREDLSDCQRMHNTVMSGFPSSGESDGVARSKYSVLYRIEANDREQSIVLLVQSAVRPYWDHLVANGYLAASSLGEENPAVKCNDEQISPITDGMVLRFRLKANPTKKVGTSSKTDRLSGAPKNNGRRVFIETPDAQIDWLVRKGRISGFELLAVSVSPGVPDVAVGGQTTETGLKRIGDVRDKSSLAVKTHRLTFRGFVFEGHLKVTDEKAFKAALIKGIGSGKAYGFGLLSVAPGGR